MAPVMVRLGVEPQQVVVGEGESADGRLGLEAAMGTMPVISMQPEGQLFGASG